jgi:hypothetical protein
MRLLAAQELFSYEKKAGVICGRRRDDAQSITQKTQWVIDFH